MPSRLTCRAFATAIALFTAALGCRGPGAEYVRSVITADPDTIDFGEVDAGSQVTRTITFRNESRLAVDVTALELEGENASSFTLIGDGLRSVAAASAVDVDVRLTAPASDGAITARVVLSSSADNAARVPVLLVARVKGAVSSCTRRACNTSCGAIDDGCGGRLECGACGDGGTNDGGACEPTTCQVLGYSCGEVPDGCGGTLRCGTCAGGEVCGISSPGVCGPDTGRHCEHTALPALPCDVAERGAVLFVSPQGTDATTRTGADPQQAFQTIGYALSRAVVGSTIKVSAGTYAAAAGPSRLLVEKDVTIKGGYDATFTAWAPGTHRAEFQGGLTLSHVNAVVGGLSFVVEHTGQVVLTAGKAIRNAFDITDLTTPSATLLSGVHLEADSTNLEFRCNEVFVRVATTVANGSAFAAAVRVVSQAGAVVIASNRVCIDSPGGKSKLLGLHAAPACSRGAPLMVVNNTIEAISEGSIGVRTEDCSNGGPDTAHFELINNTVVAGYNGIQSDGQSPIVWTARNNIISRVGPGGGSGDGTLILLSQVQELKGNLITGWATPHAVPMAFDATNLALATTTTTDVFVAPSAGDYRPLATGPAISGGTATTSGEGTVDMLLRARPSSPTTRGALLP